MRTRNLVAALALALLTPGCLGSVSAATVPANALSSNDWRQTDDRTESRALGLATIVTKEYAPNGGGSLVAGVFVVTTTDVPIFEERSLLPAAIEQIEKDEGVTLTKVGPRTLQLTSLGVAIEATEYQFTKMGVPGKAVIFTPDCPDFVVVAGYGTAAGTDGGLFGGGTEALYPQATNVARAVDC